MNIFPQFDLGADIGKGIGSGFSDTYSEIAKKGQLTKSLENIRTAQQGQPYDPLKTYASIVSTPYLDSQHAGPLSDLIRLQHRNYTQGTPTNPIRQTGNASPQSYSPLGSNQPSRSINPQVSQPTSQSFQNTSSEPINPETFRKKQTPSLRRTPTEALLKPTPVIDPQSVLQRTNELEPLYGREEASQRAQSEAEVPIREWEADQAAAKSQIAQQDDIRKRIRKEASDRLQTDEQGIFGKVPNSVFSRMENRGIEQIEDGANPDKVFQDIADRTLRLSRASENAFGIFENGKYVGGVSKLSNPVGWLKSLKNTRENFEKEGALDEFKSLLESSQGFSPDFAASLAYPLSNTTKKQVHSLVTTGKKGLLGEQYENSNDPKFRKKVDSFVSDYLKNISYMDSLQSLRKELDSYSPNFGREAFDEISRRYKENPRLLNGPQADELNASQPFIPNLADLFVTFTGGI